MNFTVINEAFQCGNCKENNPPHMSGSCRNHCRKCLHSKHLDSASPGDRACTCHSLMEPIGIDHSSKKGWILIHKCKKCGYKIRNKMAEDDNMELASQISRNPLSTD